MSFSYERALLDAVKRNECVECGLTAPYDDMRFRNRKTGLAQEIEDNVLEELLKVDVVCVHCLYSK